MLFFQRTEISALQAVLCAARALKTPNYTTLLSCNCDSLDWLCKAPLHYWIPPIYHFAIKSVFTQWDQNAQEVRFLIAVGALVAHLHWSRASSDLIDFTRDGF